MRLYILCVSPEHAIMMCLTTKYANKSAYLSMCSIGRTRVLCVYSRFKKHECGGFGRYKPLLLFYLLVVKRMFMRKPIFAERASRKRNIRRILFSRFTGGSASKGARDERLMCFVFNKHLIYITFYEHNKMYLVYFCD